MLFPNNNHGGCFHLSGPVFICYFYCHYCRVAWEESTSPSPQRFSICTRCGRSTPAYYIVSAK